MKKVCLIWILSLFVSQSCYAFTWSCGLAFQGVSNMVRRLLMPAENNNVDFDSNGVSYAQTDADLSSIKAYYGQAFLSRKNLKGKIVADFGSGPKATVVMQLRKVGIEAYAIDTKLETDPTKPYLLQTDMAFTGLPSDSIDIVLSTFSLFTYELTLENSNEVLMTAVLAEISRVLKIGGVARIAPISTSAALILEKLGKKIPSLEFQAFGALSPINLMENGVGSTMVVEIKKIDTRSFQPPIP